MRKILLTAILILSSSAASVPADSSLDKIEFPGIGFPESPRRLAAYIMRRYFPPKTGSLSELYFFQKKNVEDIVALLMMPELEMTLALIQMLPMEMEKFVQEAKIVVNQMKEMEVPFSSFDAFSELIPIELVESAVRNHRFPVFPKPIVRINRLVSAADLVRMWNNSSQYLSGWYFIQLFSKFIEIYKPIYEGPRSLPSGEFPPDSPLPYYMDNTIAFIQDSVLRSLGGGPHNNHYDEVTGALDFFSKEIALPSSENDAVSAVMPPSPTNLQGKVT